MNHGTRVAQVQAALAEYANEVHINGLSDWDASDFGTSADKFVAALDAASVMSDYLKLDTAWDYLKDLAATLSWDISAKHSVGALKAALFEVGPDMVPGVDFDVFA